MSSDQFSIQTQLAQQSENSYRTTVPSSILDMNDAPRGPDAMVRWRIDPTSGDVEVSFGTDFDYDGQYEFTKSLVRQSESSFRTTVPPEVLAIKGAPTGENAIVLWSPRTNQGLTVRFEDERNIR